MVDRISYFQTRMTKLKSLVITKEKKATNESSALKAMFFLNNFMTYTMKNNLEIDDIVLNIFPSKEGDVNLEIKKENGCQEAFIRFKKDFTHIDWANGQNANSGVLRDDVDEKKFCEWFFC